MSVVTDSKTVEDPKDPDTYNVFALFSLFASEGKRPRPPSYRAGGYGCQKQLLAKMDAYCSASESSDRSDENMDYVKSFANGHRQRAKPRRRWHRSRSRRHEAAPVA